jgi:hypothetical protein
MECPSIGVEQPGLEANHSSPSSAEVKNEWSHNSTSFICTDGMCRGDFILTYLHAYIIIYISKVAILSVVCKEKSAFFSNSILPIQAVQSPSFSYSIKNPFNILSPLIH